MAREAYNTLYDLAADQLGYFTAAQAREAGITPMAVVMMERRSVIDRVSRGVYRLLQYPSEPLAEYMAASLWPIGVQGTISHESALALYGLSDVNPARLHVTVPTSYRIRRATPKHLAIHHADLGPGDWQYYEGIPATQPSRTIRDCHRAQLGGDLIRQSIRDGYRDGHLNRREGEQLAAELLQDRLENL